MGKSIFISYRRDGGEAMAQLLHDRLVMKGFAVFYDIESLKAQQFDTRLLTEIEQCDYVVLVLPPQGLDRCRYENDWVRQEIRHALKHRKVIVPVMMRGFEFPSDLPADIAEISRYNGVRFDDMNYLDAKINKIIELFDQDSTESAIYSGNSNRRNGPSLISNVCTIGAVDESNPWPTGKYATKIDLDKYRVVYFHVMMVRPVSVAGKKKVGYFIYNDQGDLVSVHDVEVAFQPGNDRFSLGWIIRGKDGSFVKPGKYRAELWLENSRVYDYTFRVVSREQEEDYEAHERKRDEDILQQEKDPEIRERIWTLEKKLAKIKGAVYVLLWLLGGMLGTVGGAGERNVLLVLAGLILMLWSWWSVYRYTAKYVVKNALLAFLLAVVLFSFYMIYLVGAGLLSLPGRGKWKEELEKLKQLV